MNEGIMNERICGSDHVQKNVGFFKIFCNVQKNVDITNFNQVIFKTDTSLQNT